FPSPSSPAALFPQARTCPSDLSARANAPPAAIAVTPLPEPRPDTALGFGWLVDVPLPSSPEWLSPQASTEPFDSSAMLKEPPAAIAVTPLPGPRPLTATGLSTKVDDAVPLPTSPETLFPQPSTSPLDLSAMLWP